MNKLNLNIGIGLMLLLGLVLMSADHIDAPAVSGGSSDITDFYVFQGKNTDNLVFVANLQGLLSPMASESSIFNENVLVEFNIDTNGDAIEDLVIQAIPRDGKMYFFGPVAAGSTGLNSEIMTSATMTEVAITSYGDDATIGTNGNIKAFAGPRDDPFFFDFGKYNEVIAGTASSFDNPGNDTFAGTNVMSIAIEVPKSMVGGSGTINTWVETKTK